MAVKSYKELIVWQKGMDLVETVYKATAKFPKEELYGLSSQLRRAVVSVASNIAEGQGRKSTKEFIHHLSIAYGSLVETETQIEIARRLNYIEESEYVTIMESAGEIARMLNGLNSALNERLNN